MFPGVPPVELYVRRKSASWLRNAIDRWIWIKDEGYLWYWSCLPGYLPEADGPVLDCLNLDDRHYSFYLDAKPLNPSDKATDRYYGILKGVPRNFQVGATGKGTINYSGFNKARRLWEFEGPHTLYMNWVLLHAH
jgi:hypothetical protein